MTDLETKMPLKLGTCPKCGSERILVQGISADLPKYKYKCLQCDEEFDNLCNRQSFCEINDEHYPYSEELLNG